MRGEWIESSLGSLILSSGQWTDWERMILLGIRVIVRRKIQERKSTSSFHPWLYVSKVPIHDNIESNCCHLWEGYRGKGLYGSFDVMTYLSASLLSRMMSSSRIRESSYVHSQKNVTFQNFRKWTVQISPLFIRRKSIWLYSLSGDLDHQKMFFLSCIWHRSVFSLTDWWIRQKIPLARVRKNKRKRKL